MRRRFNNMISVMHSFIRMILLKIFHFSSLKFFWIERFSPNVVLEMNRGAKAEFGKMVRIHSGSKIKVRSGGKLIIGDGVRINYNCIIACHKSITIGEGSEFGPSVFIYDHDHDYREGLSNERFVEGSIVIGKSCWIGAHSLILKGTEVGDNSVIAGGSIIKGKFPPNSFIYQKKETKVSDIK